MTRRPPSHTVQLVASQAAMFAMTSLLIVAARGADGPHSRAWAPAFGGVIALWVFAVAWALLGVCLSVRDVVAEVRASRRRPRPGADGRAALLLADLHDRQAAAADRALVDRAAAGDDLADDTVYEGVDYWFATERTTSERVA